MSFTMMAVQGLFTNPDGTPASGTLCITPNSAIENLTAGESPQTMQPVCGLLNQFGRIVSQAYTALEVAATDDSGTTPIGSSYTFSLKLDGQSLVEFSTPVPHDVASWSASYPVVCVDSAANTVLDSDVVELVNLLASPSMVGASITGSGITGGATILSVDPGANTVTMSSNAIGSDAGVSIEGGCIPFTTLRANAL